MACWWQQITYFNISHISALFCWYLFVFNKLRSPYLSCLLFFAVINFRKKMSACRKVTHDIQKAKNIKEK